MPKEENWFIESLYNFSPCCLAEYIHHIAMRQLRCNGIMARILCLIGCLILCLFIYQWLPSTQPVHTLVDNDLVKPISVQVMSDSQPLHIKSIESPGKKQVIVHLDMKGAPPRISYLIEIIPILTKMGVTGLLLEYEDMFPYYGPLSTLARSGAYSNSDIAGICAVAAANKLTIIPLIQSFGHFEFVLKHDKWKHLRAEPDLDNGINPSLNDSLTLIFTMLDQMIALHPEATFIHIGGDEVYTLGNSPESRIRMSQQLLTKHDIYCMHIAALGRYVGNKWPHIKPIFWDDMIRKIPIQTLQKYSFGQLLEPMIWKYTPDLENHLPIDLWKKYSEIFPHIWIASAFKGATGQKQFITNIDVHLRNHKAWLSLIEEIKPLFPSGIRGVALTGWQRYSHHQPLCELLPAAIPSLVVCLATITNGNWNEHLWLAVTKTLKCDGLLEISMTPNNLKYEQCTFPGSVIYDGVHELHSIETALIKAHKDIDLIATHRAAKGGKRNYGLSNLKLIYTSLDDLDKKLEQLDSKVQPALQDILMHDQQEWIDMHIKFKQTRIIEVRNRIKKISS